MPRTPSNLASMKGIRGSSVTSPNVCVTVIPPTCGRKDQRRPSPLPRFCPGSSLAPTCPRVERFGMRLVHQSPPTHTHISSPLILVQAVGVQREPGLPWDWEGQRLRRPYCQEVTEKVPGAPTPPHQGPSFHTGRTGPQLPTLTVGKDFFSPASLCPLLSQTRGG